MYKNILITMAGVLISSFVYGMEDEFMWLEDSSLEKTKSWVSEQNQRTLKTLDIPAFHAIRDSRLNSNQKAKIDRPFYIGKVIAKISQPNANSKGILKVSNSFEKGSVNWRTIIDFDELGAIDNKKWEYSDSVCNPHNLNICLIGLSNNGSHQAEYREFDIEKGEFVKEGFLIPTGTTSIAWIDSDTLLVSSTYKTKALSKSDYSTELKRLKRSQSIENAEVLLTREPVGGLDPYQYMSQGNKYLLVHHWHDFYNGNTWHFKNGKLHKIDIPTGHYIYGVHKGNLVIKTYADWNIKNKTIPAGSVVAVDLNSKTKPEVELVFEQNESQSFREVYLTKSRILVSSMNELRTSPVSIHKSDDGKWIAEHIKKPSDDVLRILSASDLHPEAIVSYRGFLTASAYYFLNASTKKHQAWAASKAAFPTNKYKVEYMFAKGEDGVEIPYQIVFPKDIDKSKKYPTIVYVYGAYGLPRTEFYSDVIGKEWLERGGIYVIANARGGGAYGARWHQAAMRTTKHKTYEDVATVARSLIKKGITEPSKLGVYGGSLGGLASCSVALNYSELFSASVCKTPLLDLIRFIKLGDGNSWISELGDPNDAKERPYLETNSPYNKIEKIRSLHAPLLLTYSNDDTMHPAHARKMAAKMNKLGLEVLFYEHPEGGHSGPKSKEGKATVTAVQYSYFVDRLMGRE
jgi:prolyl oligopeptidase